MAKPKLIGPLILTFILAGPCIAGAACAWVLWRGKRFAFKRLPDTIDPRGPKGGGR